MSVNLDVLRSVAVLGVLVHHLAMVYAPTSWMAQTSAGRWPVLLFFVHTCTVLMASLERQPSLRAFVVRRVLRIYPLSLCVLALVAVARVPVMPDAVFRPVPLATWAANAALVMPFVGHPTLLAPMWSLPHELAMYTTLPALFWLVSRTRTVWPALGLWMVAALAPTAVVDVVPTLWFAPCFLGGVIAYERARHGRVVLPAWVWPCAMLAISAGYLGWSPRGDGWVSCLALGFVLPLCAELRAPWLTRPAALVAKYSYSVYLIHIPLLWAVGAGRPESSAWVTLPLFTVALLVSCAVLFHGVEAPAIALGRRWSHRLIARRDRRGRAEVGAMLAGR